MLDTDHLFLTRTTSAMLHGQFMNSKRVLSYALMTDNGEGGPQKSVFPVGWDLRYKSLTNSLILGASGYSSSISKGKSTSTVSLGEGSPKGGIFPWMSGDKFTVIGVYLEKLATCSFKLNTTTHLTMLSLMQRLYYRSFRMPMSMLFSETDFYNPMKISQTTI
jgi:hypothetical protein